MSFIFILIAICCAVYCCINIIQAKQTKIRINNKIQINNITNKLYCLIFVLVTICGIFNVANFLMDDFSYANVFKNSSLAQPIIYKITASCSGQGGSFLLWLFLQIALGFLLQKTIAQNENKNIINAIYILFPTILAIALFWNNPFEATLVKFPNLTEIPDDGLGLKLILQSPYNLLHPPFLFLGFAFLFIPYVLVLSNLINPFKFNNLNDNLTSKTDTQNKADTQNNWFEQASKFNKFGLIFLTSGIFLGSIWAYHCFGWGGFWSWDPIENAALIPMVLSIAFLHSSSIFKRNQGLLKTNYLLAIFTFPTILLATFLARSGAIKSISNHSYATSLSVVNYIILGFLLLILIGSLILFLIRRKSIIRNYEIQIFDKLTLQSAIISFGILCLMCVVFVVFIGTLLPIFSQLSIFSQLFDVKIQIITSQFYTNWLIPISSIFALLLGISAFTKDKIRMDFTTFSNKIIPSLVLSLTIMIVAFYSGINRVEHILLIFSISFAIFAHFQNLILGIIRKKNFVKKIAMNLSHIGICIFIFASILFGNFEEKFTMDLVENQIMEVGSYKIIFKQIDVTSTSENTKYSTLIEIFDDKNNSVQLVPYFVVSNKKAEAMVEMFPAVDRIGLNDIYIEPIDYFMNTRTDTYTEFQQNLVFPKLRINFFIKPFIIFVWLGGILLISGFCILLFSNRQSV